MKFPSAATFALALGTLALGALIARAVPTYSLPVPAASTTTTTPNGAVITPQLSTDGRYLTFQSSATNIISSVTDNFAVAVKISGDTREFRLRVIY